MRKLLSLMLAIVLCFSLLAGCGDTNTDDDNKPGPDDNKQRTVIKMWGYGDTEQEAEFRSMTEAFNDSAYAKQKSIRLKLTWYAETLYNQTINNGSAAVEDKVDIIFANDRSFKKWASEDYIVNLKQFTSGAKYKEEINGMWSSIHPRFRLNKDGYTSYEDDPYWGIPVDTSPTALYYNRTALENCGVIVISVDDETVTAENLAGFKNEYEGLKDEHVGKTLMELWNDNLIADKFGQYHDTCGNRGTTATGAGFEADILAKQNIDVPAKGYYRDDGAENNYRGEGTWINPNRWGPTAVVKVFNASIAMNWDEMEDIAHLLTKKFNDKTHARSLDYGSVDTTYGYYTEWWFNYGWSVGGDCLQDTTNEGTWMYGLSDWSANYKVTEAGAGYVGEATGTVYKAGDTLEFLDKLNVKLYAPLTDENGDVVLDANNEVVFNDGDILLPNGTGGLDKYDPVTKTTSPLAATPDEYTSNASIRPYIVENSTTDEANTSAKFVELPSTKAAVDRYLSNIADPSKDVMPLPASFNTSSTIQQFGNGSIAFVVERGYQIGMVRMLTGDYGIEWGIAPLPQYKEYANPMSDDVTVLREGVEGGHSEATALCIAKGSKYQQLAWQVIDWMTSDYETVNGQQEAAGQIAKAEAGYIPNQPTVANSSTFIKPHEKTLNLDIFFDALEYEEAGDWWYLPDNAWINVWASPLNSQVRNGEMTPKTWFDTYVRPSNVELLSYSYYFGAETEFQSIWYSHFGQNM